MFHLVPALIGGFPLKLQDSKDRTMYLAALFFIVLASLELVGELRGLFYDIWVVLRAIVIPLVLALIISYVLRPIVDLLESRMVPRGIGVVVTYVVVLLVFALMVINLLPAIVAQGSALIQLLPKYLTAINGLLDHMTILARVMPKGIRIGLEKAMGTAEADLVSGLSHSIKGVRGIFNGAFMALIIPFFVFYFIKDQAFFSTLILQLFPKSRQATVRKILTGIDESLGKYVRGQLFVMFAVGIVTLAGYLVIGMPFALFLALFVALTNVIPYLGPFLGATPALIMALGISHSMLVKVLVVNLIVQQIEGNVLSPWIMGKSMKLHPIFIILAVLFAGQIGGIMGLIFAVPVLAVAKVIIEQIQQVRTSDS